ncbi:hypothetical protein LTR39_006094 [Cryomyces antarcticus]|nr:hypothetical protein LTR39_006094 [Cryomyces antarcticus]
MRQKHAKRDGGRPEQVERSESSETIDVLMPASTQAPESHGSQGDMSQYGQATFDEPYMHGAPSPQPQNQRYYQQQQQQQPQSTPTPIAPRNGPNRAHPTYLYYGPDLALAPPNAPWMPSPPPAGSPGRAGGKRDTTFSSMMEKAGLRRSDFSPFGGGSPGAKGKERPRPLAPPQPQHLPRLAHPLPHAIDRGLGHASISAASRPSLSQRSITNTIKPPTNIQPPCAHRLPPRADETAPLARRILAAHTRQHILARRQRHEQREGDQPDAEAEVGRDFRERGH